MTLIGRLKAALSRPETRSDSTRSGRFSPRKQVDDLIELGNDWEASGDLDGAHIKYEEARRIAPDYARAHLNLGIVLAAKSQWDDAIAAYDQAIALDPTNAPAHYNRGLALHARGKFDLAEEAFGCALRYLP